MQISLIAAIAKNGVIGKDAALPWHFPEDMAFFREITKGKVVIMGRKTFQSLPDNARPLPKRVNIILTRDKQFALPAALGCIIVHSVGDALAAAKKAKGDEQEVMIIGGAEIYALFLPIAERLYLTRISEPYEGDAYFPDINWSDWRLIEERPHTGFVIQTWQKSV